jgi:autotransporter passenger strand-loop-strand repeat protein
MSTYYVSSGVTSTGLNLNSDYMYVYSGGVASSTSINEGGWMEVSSGGSLMISSGVDVNSAAIMGGEMRVLNGGVARNIKATTGGVFVAAGGKVTGEMDLSFGANVSFDAGSILDFDITSMSPGGAARVSNLSIVSGTPTYTLTITVSQKNGKYTLAGNASGFAGTITVKNLSGSTLGTLDVGKIVKINGVDYQLNKTGGTLFVSVGAAAVVSAKGDIDGNGVSDVLFQYTGGDYQLGYWMNGTNKWRGNGLPHPAEWDVLGSYDMNADGKADSVLFGNVTSEAGIHGAYIGYYAASDDKDANWVNIGYLNNEENIDWKNKAGNLTGSDGKNSIVWYAPELFALGVWTDGTTDWVNLSSSFGGDDWTLVGCGDFKGTGKDSVVMSYNNGQLFYTIGIDGGTPVALGSTDWRGWEIRAIGDFTGDGRDDIVLFHEETGSMVMCVDGVLDIYKSIGQLAPKDWFVVGAGDYDGDQKDDLLVRQYSTGMLGYYSRGDQSQWVEMGRGVDMKWTVIA